MRLSGWRTIVGVVLLAPLLLGARAGAAMVPSAAQAYADALQLRVPVPPTAYATSAFRPALPDVIGEPPVSGVSGVYVSRAYYLVPRGTNLALFVKTHLVPGAWNAESGWTGWGPGLANAYSYSWSIPCADPHATVCGAFDLFAPVAHWNELVVGAFDVWRPVVDPRFPSKGTATITGFTRVSYQASASGPVTVTLTSGQRARLARALSRLRGAVGGLCMEDTELFVITVRSHGRVTWMARADLCPGTLAVSWGGHHPQYNARNCALARAVRSDLPRALAATRADLAGCL